MIESDLMEQREQTESVTFGRGIVWIIEFWDWGNASWAERGRRRGDDIDRGMDTRAVRMIMQLTHFTSKSKMILQQIIPFCPPLSSMKRSLSSSLTRTGPRLIPLAQRRQQ